MNDLSERTKVFALRIIRLYKALPDDAVAQVVGKQVLRSATSVGAHYHEAQHARSRAEFASKIDVALQELQETSYWLELLTRSGTVQEALLLPLLQEVAELIAIFVVISRKANQRRGTLKATTV